MRPIRKTRTANDALGTIDLWISRSTDGGLTWNALINFLDYRTPLRRSLMSAAAIVVVPATMLGLV